MDKLVIIPTYNEIENIEPILAAIFTQDKGYHVLIIDDNSPDGTAEKVKLLQVQYKATLFLEQRVGKLGLGTAYIHGFKWALQHGYKYIFEMDADFSHNPKDLDRLYQAALQGNDLVIGSRYVPGGKIENWPWTRVLISKGASLYTKLITWMPIKDPTAGFVCYSYRLLNAINFDEIKFSGYAFQIEMKFATYQLGYTIVEVPITFIDRQHGTSKMNKSILKEGIFGVLKIQYKSWFKHYKKKVAKVV